jgi:dTMP kinase
VSLPGPAREPPAAGREPQVEWNRLDARELAYHQRVEAGYRALIAQDPERWHAFDARQSIDALAEQILAAAEPRLRHIEMLEATP